MKRRLLFIPMALVLLTSPIACTAPTPTPSLVNLEFDFRDGKVGWEHLFAEYSPDMDMQLEAGLRPLPDELGIEGTGYYLQGMNRSDALLMFLKCKAGAEDGIIPGQTYRVTYTIVFASNAPSGAVGAGGSPGEAVILMAGASAMEPEAYLDSAYYLMNMDKGAVSEVGHIANGLPAEEVDLQNPPYVSLERQHKHESTVTADSEGELWLLIGTGSGFEGLTGIYYQSIAVTLEPVE